MDLSFVIPTHNRPERLTRTLGEIGRLPPRCDAEVILFDNASDIPVEVSRTLENGWPVRIIRGATNIGTAGRNLAAEASTSPWLFMLDDDSFPTHDGYVEAIQRAGDDVFAIGARIRLETGGHEAGGLPEVIVGCGALIRREPFLELGGYDIAFDYYAEEYDLSARAIGAGWRLIHDGRVEVLHAKVNEGRDMDRILHRLVRNNGWVIQRHTPDAHRESELADMLMRYGAIAQKEEALSGFRRGRRELDASIADQLREPLSTAHYARFTGEAAVASHLPDHLKKENITRIALVARGKGAERIESIVVNAGVTMVAPGEAEALVIGTLSPGPIAEAFENPQYAEAGIPLIPAWPAFEGETPKAPEVHVRAFQAEDVPKGTNNPRS